MTGGLVTIGGALIGSAPKLVDSSPIARWLTILAASYEVAEIARRSEVDKDTICRLIAPARRRGRVTIEIVDRLTIAFDRHPAEFYPDHY